MGLDFIYILKAIFIAIVEGLTEFIPVSSTGHMILFGDLIGFRTGEYANFAATFEVVIQLGAILAVVVLYWKKLWGAVVEFFQFIFTFGKKGKRGFDFGVNVIIASIPAMILGLLFIDYIKLLFNSYSVVWGLIVGGLLLLIVEGIFRKKVSEGSNATTDVFDITKKQAITVGCFQCLAMWPGMSRSASTIMGGWISGISTAAAAEFSFFLAIPAMIGSSALDLFENYQYIQTNTQIVAIVVGFIVAFLVSLIVMDFFVSYLKKKPMRIFAIYRVIIGIILLILALAGVIVLV